MMEKHFVGKVAAKAIIAKNGKVLMTRDRRDNALWDLPGGRINAGETIETGLCREVQEELGINVRFKRMVHSEQVVHIREGSSHLFVTCEVAMDDPEQPFHIPSAELAEIKWIDKNTVKELKTYDNCKRALEMFLS